MTAPLGHLSPDEILARLSASGLRGRGGGWFPAARKWHAVRVEGGRPVLVANGAEGEPGSVKDRHVLRTRPDDVLAGLDLAARALGAREAFVYLKGSFAREEQSLAAALARRGPGPLQVRVVRGADSYVAGEESAVLEALMGRRPWPREKPPYPAAVGFEGRPTLVQNVETLARVPAAVADPAAYRAGETTLVSLWGQVRRPGVCEVPLGTPVREVVERHGQGPTDGWGLVFPAGPSAPPLAPEALDTPLDPDALRAAGSGLGSASLLVTGASLSPLQVSLSAARFFERESCGQCPPCAVGTARLAGFVANLVGGRSRPAELGHLREAAGFMRPHGYCAHARTAAGVVTALLQRGHAAVEARLAGQPDAGRVADPFAPGSPERLAIEGCLD